MAQHVEAVRCNGVHSVLFLVGFAVAPTSCEHAYFFLCVHARLAGLRALTKEAEAERKESKAQEEQTTRSPSPERCW